MIPAPVGYHCPVCTGRMGEGSLSRATYRTRAGVERRASKFPLARVLRGASVTQTIIAINVVVVLLMYATGRPTSGRTLLRFGALPGVLLRSEWWRMFTAMFVHIGALHLLFNTWALMLFGPALEERYGRLRFLVLYLASGFLGSAFSLAFTRGGLRAGASGAVFGILGAWLAFFLRHRNIPSLRGQLRPIVLLIGINLLFSVAMNSIDNVARIDMFAHVGGLVAGFVVGGALDWSRPRVTRGSGRAWLVALAATLGAGVWLALPHMV